VSRELFEPGGFIVESITYEADSPGERDHWWFERGMPVRQVKEGREYVRRENRWTATKAGSAPAKQERPGRPGTK
jgi:hypothetical protein